MRTEARGFTLVELLVVILVVGILLAVVAPRFLGQSGKAYEARAKQNLTLSYKAATAWAAQNDGTFVNATELASAIQSSEPHLTVIPSSTFGNVNNENYVYINIDGSGVLYIRNRDHQGYPRMMVVPTDGPPYFSP